MADPGQPLASRLRALREERWSSRRVTQRELASALGVSVPLISSWESPTTAKVPPLQRIDALAALFASPEAFERGALSQDDLTDEERPAMAELSRELRALRGEALRTAAIEVPAPRTSSPSPVESLLVNPWHFGDGRRITIVCAQLPQHMLEQIPYTNVDDPDYIELLTYSELDSLFELHGHIRASNPGSDVFLRTADKLGSDDLHSHLAVLGGVDWNAAARDVLARLDLPVRQVANWDVEGGQYYEVPGDTEPARYRPVLHKPANGSRPTLTEDVALFARAVNPFNRKRTVTICNGMYGRGTYGAVRALTDMSFRDRNSEYVLTNYGESNAFCILTRVAVVRGTTTTPDWTGGEHILFEWSR